MNVHVLYILEIRTENRQKEFPSARQSVCLSICQSVDLSACLPVRPPACLSVCRSVRLSVCLPARLSFGQSVCLAVCPSVCRSACLSICIFVRPSVCTLGRLKNVPGCTITFEGVSATNQNLMSVFYV